MVNERDSGHRRDSGHNEDSCQEGLMDEYVLKQNVLLLISFMTIRSPFQSNRH